MLNIKYLIKMKLLFIVEVLSQHVQRCRFIYKLGGSRTRRRTKLPAEAKIRPLGKLTHDDAYSCLYPFLFNYGPLFLSLSFFFLVQEIFHKIKLILCLSSQSPWSRWGNRSSRSSFFLWKLTFLKTSKIVALNCWMCSLIQCLNSLIKPFTQLRY